MKVILCIDNDGGMMFNKRRLSRDRILYEKITELTKESILWLNSYSYPLFDGFDTRHIKVSEDFIDNSKDDDFCFVENISLKPFESRINNIILFKWNRTYPKDLFFDIDISDWTLTHSSDFAGSSHEKITMEVYIR